MNYHPGPGPSRYRWIWLLLGTACMVVPVVGIAWWIYVAETTPGEQAELVQRFLSPFPDSLQDARLVTAIEIGFCGGAMGFAYLGVYGKGASRVFSRLLLGFSGLIGFWLLFSLM